MAGSPRLGRVVTIRLEEDVLQAVQGLLYPSEKTAEFIRSAVAKEITARHRRTTAKRIVKSASKSISEEVVHTAAPELQQHDTNAVSGIISRSSKIGTYRLAGARRGQCAQDIDWMAPALAEVPCDGIDE